MKKSSIDRFFNRFSVAACSPGKLLTVHMELTRRCNLHCKHCYLPFSKCPADIPELELSSVKQIIDELHAAGCLLITLTGGEAFVRSDITFILEYLWSKGFIVMIVTNGTLIDNRMAQFLSKAGSPTYLNVSLYGFSENTTRYVTGVDGVAKKTLSTIELLKENRVAFGINVLITKKNLKELGIIRSLARRHKVHFAFQYLIYPRLDGSTDVLRHQIPLKDVKKLLCDEIGSALCGDNILSVASGVVRTTPFRCSAGKTSMVINAFGKACACVSLPLPGVDILSMGVEASWRKVVEYVAGAVANDIYHCHECDLYQFCTWCPAMGWLYKKDINACVPFYKREAQIEKTVWHG